jgi:hypothetical protein
VSYGSVLDTLVTFVQRPGYRQYLRNKSGFLEDCGLTAEVRGWGNRKTTKANFARWRDCGRRRDLKNEPDFPLRVWAYARKQGRQD